MSEPKVKVSVVIPCYNQGMFVCEAVESVLRQTFSDFEIIIVNDGSTDAFTNQLLATLNFPKTRVITTENQGLPRARNTGIQGARGEYILPLDGDDKIAPAYLEKAVKILDENPQIGIVYCQARLFGVKNEIWRLPPYSFPEILNGNQIFCTALFRRTDWCLVDGYKKEMRYGWEDFEFWLSLIERGREVYQIPEELFFYRTHEVSMTTRVRDLEERQNHCWCRIFEFHLPFYLKYFKRLSTIAQGKLYLLGYKKRPFFWKERTPVHKIYHFGKITIRRRRRQK